jgi:hypothetical protein
MSFGQFDAGTDKSEYNAISFLIEQAMLKMQTVTLVKVIAVHGNGVGITGTVDVQPMVNQMQAGPNGTQTAVAHGTIYGVPFFRLQGGSSAFICDPVAGDIGLCGFAARDISSVKSTRAVANPGSQRTYDWADGLYVGGFINGVPTQYIQALASAGGWKIVTPGDITLDSPLTEVTGDLKVDGGTTLEGDTTVEGSTTLVGPTTTADLTSTGVITAAGFSGPGGTSPAGPPGPPGPTGPTGPTGPAFLDVTGPGGFSLTGVTNAAFAGSCTVTGSGTSVTITITGGGGSITDITGSSFITISNGTGPTVGVDLSTAFQAAYAATAALAVAADALAATALQPITGLGGSYTNADITLNSNGQITAVSNGTGGGGSATFVNANVTVDSHPLVPTPRDDEFEGSSLSGQWTAINWNQQGGSPATSAVTYAGNLVFTSELNTSGNRDPALIVEPILAAQVTAGAWTYRAKLAQFMNAGSGNLVGFALYEAGSGKIMDFSSFNGNNACVAYRSAFSSFALASSATGWPAFYDSLAQDDEIRYLQISLAAGTITWSLSVNGIEFRPYYSESITAHFTTAPDHIGFLVESVGSSVLSVLQADWIRDYTNGYAPDIGQTPAIAPFNVTPDTHTNTPTFLSNDEFEEATLDTGGTRFAGALPWTWANQGGASASLSNGCLHFLSDINPGGGRAPRYILQALPSGATAWRYRSKMASYWNGGAGNVASALAVFESATTKTLVFNTFTSGGAFYLADYTYPSFTSVAGINSGGYSIVDPFTTESGWRYFEVELAAAYIIFRLSLNGEDGTFKQYDSLAVSSYFTTGPDMVGMSVECCGSTVPTLMNIDWFRRIA